MMRNDAKAAQTQRIDLSRRDFMWFSAAAGMLVLSGTAISGCAPKDSNEHFGGEPMNLPANDAAAVNTQDEEPVDKLDTLIASLTIEQKVAQMFVVRPEDMLGVYRAESGAEDTAVSGSATEGATTYFEPLTAVNDDIRAAIQKVPVGGFAFFGDNLLDPAQTKALLEDMRACSVDTDGVEPLLCVDEEGGTVARIARNTAFGVENVGDMADVGATGDATAARDVAEEIAGYLEPLGFNTDFAPVCDVANNPDSQVMSQRSFGADASEVAKMVYAEVEGFEESGLICCLKHFPGLGGAVGDSHDSRIVIDSSLSELEECELKPFAAGIAAGAPMVMVGHLSVPSITGDDIPASLSKKVVTGVLREDMGFEGVVITDSMGMGAVTDYYSVAEATVGAVEAGCDIVLMPSSLQEAYIALLFAVREGEIPESRIDESVRRILTLKESYL